MWAHLTWRFLRALTRLFTTFGKLHRHHKQHHTVQMTHCWWFMNDSGSSFCIVSTKTCLAPFRKESGNRIGPKLETFNSVGVGKVGKLDAANGKKLSYLKLCSAWARTSPCTPREIPRAHPTSPAAPQESEGSASSASSADVLKPERTQPSTDAHSRKTSQIHSASQKHQIITKVETDIYINMQ